MDTSKLLTVQEAARSLNVDPNAIYIAIREERLRSVEVLGRKAIEASALEEFRQRTRPGGQKPKGRPKGSKNMSEKVSLK